MNPSDIQKDFEKELAKSSWWRRTIGSQFVAYLSLFIAQIVDRVTRAGERALQESFLSLAVNRRSILAGAESVGHVGRKISPSIGKVRVTNVSSERVTLPAKAQCIAGNQKRYTILDSIDLQPNETKEYEVQQFEIYETTYIVDDEKAWLSIVFSQEMTARTHKLHVSVNGQQWNHAFKFRGCDNKSRAYMEYYKSTDQLGIRFGNGITGQIPRIGDHVLLEFWLTEGDTTLIDGQKLELVDTESFTGSGVPVKIETATTVTGGAEGEDIESIRNGALYATPYDNQIAWDSDYKTFIRNNLSGMVWLSVWGEQEEEELKGKKDIRNINRIFISAYSNIRSEDVIKEQILGLFNGRNGYNEIYEYVPRKDVPFTVKITGYVVANVSPKDVEQAVKAQLAYKFGKNSKSKIEIFIKDIWSSVDEVARVMGLSEYKVEATGLLEKVPIDTYHYLDSENSTFSFTHRPV